MRVGIIGAGITGLALTHFLDKQGIESVAFEAANQSGGVITSDRIDGRVVELGPQRMRKTPAIQELAESAGVADDIVEATDERLYVYSDGSLGEAPLSKRQFVSTDLLSVSGKARLLAEPFTRRGREDETVEHLFIRKFGREAYERFIGPLYGGIYGSDPAAMPAAFALRELLERERESKSMLRSFLRRVSSGHTAPPISFTEGNQQLPAALTEMYADRIELSTPVTGIHPGDQYRVETKNASEAFDRVVITSGASPTAELLEPLAEAGLVSGLRGLRELQYNPLVQVFLESNHDYGGKGYQVGFDEEMHTLGSSWNANMFDRDGVQTVFLGGMHEPEVIENSDERLATIACQEFEAVVGSDASCLGVSRLEPGFPAWDTSWWGLEQLTLPDGITLATNYTDRMGIPSRVREARELAESFASQVTSAEETERLSIRSNSV